HPGGSRRADARLTAASGSGPDDALRVGLAAGGRRRGGAAGRSRTETSAGIGGAIHRKRPSSRGDGMKAKRRARTKGSKPRTARAAGAGVRVAGSTRNGSFDQAIQKAGTGTGTVSVEMVNL